jgi:hypothetical protein
VSVIVEDPRCLRKLKDFYRFLASGGQLLEPGKAEQFLRKDEDEA